MNLAQCVRGHSQRATRSAPGLGGSSVLHHRVRIMDFATKHRLSGVHAYVELVESGGLLSYVPSYAGMHRRAAYFVDKILRRKAR